MKIGFFSTDWSNVQHEGKLTPGGANWYRLQLPRAEFERAGYDVVTGPSLGQRNSGEFELKDVSTGEMVGDLDVVILQRWMDSHAAPCILKARSTGQLVLNDIDDWWFGLSTQNAAFYGSHPRINPNSNIDHYAKACAASDALICSTPWLANAMQRRTGARTFVVRNRIDAERWQQKDVSGDMVVGWTGSLINRSGDLNELAGVLRPFLERHAPDVGFFHGGADNPRMSARTILKISDAVPGKSMPMQTILNYPRFLRRFNVGIVPLSSVPFNNAKSAIKGMEYAAAGIPFIATASPEYQWLAQTHGIGLLARRPKDWMRHLERLRDPDERVRLGADARTMVQALDVAGLEREYLAMFEELGVRNELVCSARIA